MIDQKFRELLQDTRLKEFKDPLATVDYFEQHPIFLQISDRVKSLQEEQYKLEKMTYENPSKWQLTKLAQVENDLKLFLGVLEYLKENFEGVDNYYRSFEKCLGAAMEGEKLLSVFEDLKEMNTTQFEEIDSLLDFMIKNKTLDTEKTNILKDKLRSKSKELFIKLDKLINDL